MEELLHDPLIRILRNDPKLENVRDICRPGMTHEFAGCCSAVHHLDERCRVRIAAAAGNSGIAGNRWQGIESRDWMARIMLLSPPAPAAAASPSLLLSRTATSGGLELAAREQIMFIIRIAFCVACVCNSPLLLFNS